MKRRSSKIEKSVRGRREKLETKKEESREWWSLVRGWEIYRQEVKLLLIINIKPIDHKIEMKEVRKGGSLHSKSNNSSNRDHSKSRSNSNHRIHNQVIAMTMMTVLIMKEAIHPLILTQAATMISIAENTKEKEEGIIQTHPVADKGKMMMIRVIYHQIPMIPFLIWEGEHRDVVKIEGILMTNHSNNNNIYSLNILERILLRKRILICCLMMPLKT